MVRLKKNRLKASSLLETIVAMMIILSVFGIGMMIYLNVVKAGINLSDLQAAQQLNEIANLTKSNKSYFDETIEGETITIQKTITKYNDAKNLILLHLSAKDKTDKVIATRKEIILKSAND